MRTVLEIVDAVLEPRNDLIGTHYDGCWQNHLVCLAAYIKETVLLEQSTSPDEPEWTQYEGPYGTAASPW